ncbi:permease prefix domain 1-containing protein [Kocuria sp. CH-021]|uniref:permease prefix domain 1-containing protein n=1 Tax=Kocuria sp. CH-021 TaxID=3406735 RepID=UPI003C728431
MSASTLTPRTESYLQEVARRLPPGARADVSRELRGTVADMVDDGVAQGLPPDEAERRALEELGDPALLAEDYGPGPRHLIGPAHYHDFLELLRVLVPVLAGLFGGLTLLGRLFGEAGREDLVSYLVLSLAPAVGAAIQGALMGAGIAVVVFAVVERTEAAEAARRGDRGGTGGQAPPRWTVERLPPPRPERDGTAGELVWATIALGLAFAAPFLLSRPLFREGPLAGEPLLDPAVWTPWVPLYLGIVLLAWGWELLRFRRRRWSWALFGINAVLDLAMAALLVTVLRTESVVNPVLRERGWVGDEFAQIGVAVVVGVTVWDLVATFLSCRRSVARQH